MTKEQVIKMRAMYEKFGYYQIIVDNGKLMYDGIEGKELIWDDINELVHSIKRNDDQYHGVKDTIILTSSYETIQYFTTFHTPEQRKEFLETLQTDNVITEELKNKILETFK